MQKSHQIPKIRRNHTNLKSIPDKTRIVTGIAMITFSYPAMAFALETHYYAQPLKIIGIVALMVMPMVIALMANFRIKRNRKPPRNQTTPHPIANKQTNPRPRLKPQVVHHENEKYTNELFDLISVVHPEMAHEVQKDKIRELVANGANINAHGKGRYKGWFPLMIVAQGSQMSALPNTEKEDIDMVRLFISLGADVNQKNPKGRTTLHSICYNDRYVNTAKLLIKFGADINALDNHNNTPLKLSKKANCYALVSLLKFYGGRE